MNPELQEQGPVSIAEPAIISLRSRNQEPLHPRMSISVRICKGAVQRVPVLERETENRRDVDQDQNHDGYRFRGFGIPFGGWIYRQL